MHNILNCMYICVWVYTHTHTNFLLQSKIIVPFQQALISIFHGARMHMLLQRDKREKVIIKKWGQEKGTGGAREAQAPSCLFASQEPKSRASQGPY